VNVCDIKLFSIQLVWFGELHIFDDIMIWSLHCIR